MTITVVYGPPACGKTRNAEALRAFFRCRAVGKPEREDLRAIPFDDAMRMIDQPAGRAAS